MRKNLLHYQVRIGSVKKILLMIGKDKFYNEFAKAHPDKIYFLDEAEQKSTQSERGQLPYHIHYYGVDTELKGTTIRTIRTIREYIITFNCFNEAGRAKLFFELTASGNCLDGRLRSAAEFAATKLSDLKTLHELMRDYTKEYQAYRLVIDDITDIQSDVDHFVCFVVEYHQGKYYKASNDILAGIISSESSRKYAVDYLAYESKTPADDKGIMSRLI